MSRSIMKVAVVDRPGNPSEAVWSIVRDTVSGVLREAQRGLGDGKIPQPTGDLRIRYHYNPSYLRDEIIVSWDEVS